MDNKKLFQIAAILVAGIWIATIGTIIVLRTTDREPSSSAPIVTTVPSATVPTTKYVPSTPESTVPIGGNSVITTVKGETPQWKVEHEASVSASIAQSKENVTKPKGIMPVGRQNIINAYVRGINNLKNTKKFNMTSDSYMNILIDDITGGTVVKNAVEKVIAENQVDSDKSYSFKNGTSEMYETPMEVIPPQGKRASLKDEIVNSASVKSNSDGGYTITIKLKDEFQNQKSGALLHEGVMPIIHLEELMPTGATIEEYEILYSAATITATFDKNNRLIYLEHYLSVPTGGGNGKMTLIPVHLAMHGDYSATYEISY